MQLTTSAERAVRAAGAGSPAPVPGDCVRAARLCMCLAVVACLLVAASVSIAQEPLAGVTASTPVAALPTSANVPRLARLPPVIAPGAPAVARPRDANQASFQATDQSTAERILSLEASVRELQASEQRTAVESSSGGTEVGADKRLEGSWDNGLKLQSKNKDFRVNIGGRTQYDNSFFANDSALTVPPAIGGIGPQPDSFQFRRGRLRIEGTMYENFEFAAEYDFVNTMAPAAPSSGQPVVAVPGITDLWGTVTHLPRVGNVRIGNMKEPIGMEHLTSSRFLPFIERSFLQDVVFGPFNNGFTPGVMIFNMREDERATWAIGWFSAHNDAFGYGIGPESAVTGRVTWLPVYDELTEGRTLWHIGLAGSVRGADEGQTRVRARGNIRSGPPGVLNPIYVDTGTMAASTINYFAAETAVNAGPLTIQAEFTGIVITDAVQPFKPPAVPVDRGTLLFYGGYVQALWFLTGENSNYSRTRAAFDRVVPYENFFFVRSGRGEISGRGAWQIGARYDAIKLNDDGINGGIAHGFTFGVNWYWNPNMKLQLNYDLTHRTPVNQVPAGYINGWGIRYAMDF